MTDVCVAVILDAGEYYLAEGGGIMFVHHFAHEAAFFCGSLGIILGSRFYDFLAVTVSVGPLLFVYLQIELFECFKY